MTTLNYLDDSLSAIALGMWRIADKRQCDIDELICRAVECGINTFDNADIYGGGKCEELFGNAIKNNPSVRDKIVVQTKCGIGKNRYDLSYKHIIESVEGSLARLKVDVIDYLLLHRPDPLMRGEEIAHAFDELKAQGKVRRFGVSNFNARQMDYLDEYLSEPLCVNQIQFGLTCTHTIDSGINFNTAAPAALMRDDGVLLRCRQKSTLVQCYSPVQCDFTRDDGFHFHGSLFQDEAKRHYFSLYSELMGLSRKYGVTPEAIAVAWCLHLPQPTQVILGTTNIKHLENYVIPCKITDDEWFKLYTAAGNTII